jgi:hypothetical protein
VEEGQNFDKTWGGLPVVIFFGDDVQLPPVLDSPVYNTSSKTPALPQEVSFPDFFY